MTREEARKLIGGYATGSLTESERAALFQAALDDQDLFDELAGEHSLKELIDAPGARNRLISALTPEPPRRALWPWAAIFATATVAVTIWALLPHTVEAPVEAPVQVAQAPATDAFRDVPTPATEPPPQIQEQIVKAAKPKPSASPAPTSVSTEPPAPAIAAPVAPPPPPAAAPPAAIALAEQALLKTETAEVVSQPAVSQMFDQRSSAGVIGGFSQAGAAKGGGVAVGAAAAAKGGPKGVTANVAGRVTLQPLTYEFTANRKLRIVPAQPGTLQVTVGPDSIFPRNPVLENTPIEIAVPDNAVSVRIEFTPNGGAALVVIPSVPQQ